MMSRYLYLITVLLFSLSMIAQDEENEQDLEKQIQNPVASLISLPFQNNMDFGVGPDDRTRNTLNIQPVWPFSLNENLNLITRTIIPIISQPLGANDSEFGLGDINMSLFLTSAKPKKVITGYGLALGFPTASNDVLGFGKLTTGPSFLILVQPGDWTVGALVQNSWSIAG
ncbi:MAG: neuromedin U, partial [Bacteroidetes bacterium]|nr:neuromedin U [Bacteroidota bacterium]